MPKVPEYDLSIGIDQPGVPSARIEPITPAAAATGVAEAGAKLGGVVEQIGLHLEGHMAQQAKIAAQSEVYSRLQSYQDELQNKGDGEGGWLTRQGNNARGALLDFDRATKGVPPLPGRKGEPPLMAKYLDGLTGYQQKMFLRGADQHTTVMRGSVIKHEIQQTRAAEDASFNGLLTRQVNLGANVTGVEGLKAAEKAISDTYDQSAHWKSQGHGDDITAQAKQTHINDMTRLAVEANIPGGWQNAQHILEASSVSPEAKLALQHTINGARIGQYSEALEKKIITDPNFRTEGGLIDEGKAMSFVEARIGEQEKSASPLPAGHFSTIVSGVRSQIGINNQSVTQRQQLVMNKASTEIWNAQQSGMSPTEAYDKFIKQGQFDNAIERGKADDVFRKVFSKDPTALDAVSEHMTQTQKDSLKQVRDSEEARKKFPYPEDMNRFIDSLKQQVIEKHIQGRAGINQLFQDQLKAVPSGTPKWFGRSGSQEQEFYKTAISLQKNQTLVKAVGGTAAAAELARRIGGPDKLLPDTPESKAVMHLLSSSGWKPSDIDKNTIDEFKKKYPDLVK